VDDGGLVEVESESEFDARSLIRRYPVRSRAHPLIRKTSGLSKEVGVVFLDHKRGSDDDVASMSVNSKRIANPVLFICDVQEKFRGAIWEFDKVYVVLPFVESKIFCCTPYPASMKAKSLTRCICHRIKTSQKMVKAGKCPTSFGL
jgi:hypothetical protein